MNMDFKSLIIHNKEVVRIEVGEGVLWEKETGNPYKLILSSDKNSITENETVTITATLKYQREPLENQKIFFSTYEGAMDENGFIYIPFEVNQNSSWELDGGGNIEILNEDKTLYSEFVPSNSPWYIRNRRGVTTYAVYMKDSNSITLPQKGFFKVKVDNLQGIQGLSYPELTYTDSNGQSTFSYTNTNNKSVTLYAYAFDSNEMVAQENIYIALTPTISLHFTGIRFSEEESSEGLSGSGIVIDWGDGSTTDYTGRNSLRHTYSVEGDYFIKMTGNITGLGNFCFYLCYGLTSVVIPDSVTSLGNYCFYDCYRLTSINIPDSITSLGNSCFRDCSGLTEIVLNWVDDDIIPYNSTWITDTSSNLKFIIPVGTTQDYIDEGYPSEKLMENEITLTVHLEFQGVTPGVGPHIATLLNNITNEIIQVRFDSYGGTKSVDVPYIIDGEIVEYSWAIALNQTSANITKTVNGNYTSFVGTRHTGGGGGGGVR